MFLIKHNNDFTNNGLGNLQAANIDGVLKTFIGIKVYFKNGNPKKFDRQQFGYFSKDPQYVPAQTFDYGGQYVSYYPNDPNPLPSVGGKTVTTSKAAYPEVWKTLQEYVGFSTTLIARRGGKIYRLPFQQSISSSFNIVRRSRTRTIHANIQTFLSVYKIGRRL